MKIHPFADRFPMLPHDQLEDLANDILEHGQVYPIMTDSNEVLLDGRNRLAACAIAKVKPKVEVWNGEDAVAYILSVNVHRRHIPKSIQAMAIALAYPQPSERGRGKKQNIESLKNIGSDLLSRARTIIREFGADSEQVRFVMAGGSLDQAYQAGLEQKRLKEELESHLKSLRETIESVREEQPVTIETDLSLITFTSSEGSEVTPPLDMNRLAAQRRLLQNLIDLDRAVAALNQDQVIDQLYDAKMFINAVRSSASRIIAGITQLAKNYNNVIAQPTIKRVK